MHRVQRCDLLLWTVAWSVCLSLSVCLLVTTVSCAKTAELIKVPFGAWTLVRKLTCHNGVTQCCLPHGRGDITAFTPAEAVVELATPE